MKTIEIGGWRVARLAPDTPDGQLLDVDALAFIDAAVPGSIHYDLTRAGLLENVYGDIKNIEAARWVSQSEWVYETRFGLEPDMLVADVVELCLPCVDTFADVFVNGLLIGACDNMYRQWTFELPVEIRKPDNRLVVRIRAHRRPVPPLVEQNVELIGCDGDEEPSREKTLVRRYQRSYNIDYLGGVASLQGIGLMRPVSVRAYALPQIVHTEFAVLSLEDGRAEVCVLARLRQERPEPLTVTCRMSLSGQEVYRFEGVAQNGQATLRATLENPSLWWPNGSGAQTLYDLAVFVSSGGDELCVSCRKVGIRAVALRLRKPNGRQDFQFVINGRELYVRGANWVPVDMLSAFGSREQCEQLLHMCVHAHMNMLRLWGGGMEETDWFYSRCDELGILVWQDAHMHSHTYPDYREEFIDEMTLETREMIGRLRSHPCFALLCGGNEQQEGWDDWNWRVMHDRFYGERLIYDALPALAREACPEIPYISNSPYGEKNSQSPVDGDTHTWGNFINATEDPLFVTETCWHSGTISSPETLGELMGIDADQFQGLRWHRRFGALTGHKLYQLNQYSEYHLLSDLRSYALGLEIEQARADYTALWYLRTRSPSNTGILYWPLNKGGPMMNFGCVDYGQRPLLPYYLLPKLFADVVLHAYRDGNDIQIVASNIGAETAGQLRCARVTSDGQVLERDETDVKLSSSVHVRLGTLKDWYARVANRWREMVRVASGITLSREIVHSLSGIPSFPQIIRPFRTPG